MPIPHDKTESLEPQLAKQIDQLCESFESAWQRGDDPQVETWLERVEPKLRPVLQRALEAAKTALVASTIEQNDTTRPTPEHRPAAPQPVEDLISIPGYLITGKIAEGGMGRVYAARDLTLYREVAIKTLRPGADAVRFFVESQITARLPHPGIPPAHVLGMLADGMPYLVMKLIRGQTLAELLYERPSLEHELPRFVQIFEQIAQAVGFAHAQGIVHRDLKPANVMVGAFGEVQVMDWGLAKELSNQEPERQDGSAGEEDVTQTVAGSILGTPGYMSPEQARGELVDRTADVFALGSILAMILTGQPAIVGRDKMEMILNAAKEDLDDVFARLRGSHVDRELGQLAIHCLAARTADRPPDARAVAERVSSYRAEVEARLRRAETDRKRRQALQWAAVVIAIVLLLGIVGTSIGLVRANSAAEKERIANGAAQTAKTKAENAAAKEKLAREQTEKQLTQIEKGVELFAGMLSGINPRSEEQGGDPLYVQLRKRAEAAAEQLDAEAVGDPLAVARLQTILGNTLQELGNAPKAVEVLEKALATRERELGADHSDTLISRNNLALAYQGAGQLDKALPLLEATFRVYEAQLPPDDADFLISRANLASAYRAAGHLDKALPLLEETLRAYEAKLTPDDPVTLGARNNLALAYHHAGHLDKALPLYESTARDLEVKLGIDHPDTLISRHNLAAAYQAAGQIDKGLALEEATLKAQEAKLGADHPETLRSRNNLAFTYQAVGQLGKALPLFESTLQTQERVLAPDHPDTLSTRNNLAAAYRAAGQIDKALPLLEATLQIRESKLGSDHPDTLTSRNSLAIGFRAAGRLDKALPLFESTLKGREEKLGADHPDTLASCNNLAVAYRDSGQLDKALPLYETTLQTREAKLGYDHPETMQSRVNLAQAFRDLRQFDKAEKLYQAALEVCTAKLGPDHPDTLRINNGLATVYRDAGQLDKALPLYEATLKAREEKLGTDHPDTLNSRINLAVAYQIAGQLDKALPLFEQAAMGLEKRRFQHESARGNIASSIAAYEQAGQRDKAEAWRRKWLAHVRDQAGVTSPAYAGELTELGLLLLKQQKCAEAETVLRESLSIWEQLHPDAWPTFVAQSLLGGALLGQKKYTEAEPLLLKGYEGLKAREQTIPPQSAKRLPEALDRLIDLYTALDKPDEMKKWQEERAKHQARKPD